MDSAELVDTSANLLERVLSFFSRVETKASVVLGVDIGMLGYLASKMPARAHWDYWMLIALVPTSLITASLVQLYRCSFPDLAGGHDSLQYFKEIAKRTETRFVDDFAAQSTADVAKDVLGQVWRNSQILTKKLNCLKSSYALCAWAVVPWAASIAVFVLH